MNEVTPFVWPISKRNKSIHICYINYSLILPQSVQAQPRQWNFNLKSSFLHSSSFLKKEPLKKKKNSKCPLSLLKFRKISQFLKSHISGYTAGEKKRDITQYVYVFDLTVWLQMPHQSSDEKVMSNSDWTISVKVPACLALAQKKLSEPLIINCMYKAEQSVMGWATKNRHNS